MKKSVTPKKIIPKSNPHTEEIKRYIKEINKDTQRYLGAIAEDFGERVSAIAEQFSGLNKKLDNHTKILDSHTHTLSSHTQMIGQLMVDVQEIKTDLKQKVDRSEFSRLEKRVIALETGRRLVGLRK